MLRQGICLLKELLLCFQTSCGESLCWVLWETILLDDDLVQVVFKEICALVSAVTVVNRKIAAFRPFLDVGFRRWLGHVQDNRNAVLVVVALDALVGVGGVAGDQAVSLARKFRLLKVFQRIRLVLFLTLVY